MLQIEKWHKVEVTWISPERGGRKMPPPTRKYLCVSRFPNDISEGGSWSVEFDFEEQILDEENFVSIGSCRFLVENAPEDNFYIFVYFDIYEGPKIVGSVRIIDNLLE